MSYFEFPHTRTYDSDLGWLIKNVKETIDQLSTLSSWSALHKLEYEELKEKVDGLINNLVDVIVPWDSSIAYKIFSLVEYQGTNYIAIQDVPVGAMITNTDYWQPANTVVEQINAIGVTVSDISESLDHLGNKFYNLADYLTPDDETAQVTNNQIMQGILNEDTPAKIIYAPRGYHFYIGAVTFTKSNMLVTGGGTLHGSWECGQMEYERLFNIAFRDVIFNGDSGENSATATNFILKLRFMDNPLIEDCEFRNAKYAIYIPEQTSLGFQHFREARITNNTFKNCGYCLFSEEQDTQWNIGDIVVANNIMFATISHIDLARVDGMILTGNTFFFPSYDTQSPYKTYNIRIKRCNWTVISQNNIFEAGYCGIYITNASNTKIINNNIAWPGQRDQDNGDGIRLEGDANRGSIYNIIQGNQITAPTGRGIYLISPYESIVTGNNVGEPSRASNFYYGSAAFENAKYNAFASTGAVNVMVTNNKTNGGSYEKAASTYNYLNLQTDGINNGRYTKRYNITSVQGSPYVTLDVDDYVDSAIVIATQSTFVEPIIVTKSGNKQILICRPTFANFQESRSYTIEVLMNVNGQGF